MVKEKRELVVDLLKKNTEGLTNADISKLLKISRNTIAIILAELRGAQLVRERPIGIAKLYYWDKQ